MMKRKYVIMEQSGTGYKFGVVFPTFVAHKHMRVIRCEPISAGFVDITVKDGDFKVKCYGTSVTLGLKSRDGDDDIVLKTINSELVI